MEQRFGFSRAPALLGVQSEAGEDDDRNKENEEEKTKLVTTSLDCLAENLEVVQELEEPEDAHHPRCVQDFNQCCALEHEKQVQWDYHQQVNPVLQLLGKLELTGTENQAQQEFQSEPTCTHRVYDRQRVHRGPGALKLRCRFRC